MKRFNLILICAAFALTAAGCGTIRGVGEDVSTVGGWFVKGSDGVKDNMTKERTVK